MAKEFVIIVTPCNGSRDFTLGWDAGDSIIYEGILRVLPELYNYELIFSLTIPKNEVNKRVKEAKAIVVAGSPSWMNESHRVIWKACIEERKSIFFLGIGLANHYANDWWAGREQFIELIQSGLIELIITRDRYAYYWICQRSGMQENKVTMLPCPAFYTFPIKPTVERKKEVVFGIANPWETSCSTPKVWEAYYEKVNYLLEELKKANCNIYVTYQRTPGNYVGWIEEYEKNIAYPMFWFKTPEEFENFHKNKDVYIGFRNHGALPSAGSGMPSLLLGTDFRQSLGEMVPFLAKQDI